MNLLSHRTAPRLSYGHSPSAGVCGPSSAPSTGMLPRHRIERRIEAEAGHGGVALHVGHGWATLRLQQPRRRSNFLQRSSSWRGKRTGRRAPVGGGCQPADSKFRQLAENTTTHRHRHTHHEPCARRTRQTKCHISTKSRRRGQPLQCCTSTSWWAGGRPRAPS